MLRRSDIQRPGFLHRLEDGRTVFLGPVLPEDKARIRAGFHQLSPNSRYRRFFSGVTDLTKAQLQALAEADQRDHVVWCVLDPAQPGLPGLGLGRWVRDVANPARAEMALTVLDDHQRRGLGARLLALIYLQALQRDVSTLIGYVLFENRPVATWLGRLGAKVTAGSTEYDTALPVLRDWSRLPPNASAQRFRELLTTLNRELAAMQSKNE